jgi:hypothetical protein
MHPILSQALLAERAREWEDRAARYRLAKQWRRARRQAAQAAAGSPRPAAEVPLARASSEPVAVTTGQPTAAEDRQPVGRRAA